MIPALQADYLFVGARIRERLAAELPELAVDGAIRAVEQMEQAVQAAPSEPVVFVAWDGDRFDGGDQGRAGGGSHRLTHQGWTIVVLVMNSSQHEGDARNAQAGPYLARIHKALAGWKPEGAVHSLQRVQGQRPRYPANAGLYPLSFEIDLNL